MVVTQRAMLKLLKKDFFSSTKLSTEMNEGKGC